MEFILFYLPEALLSLGIVALAVKFYRMQLSTVTFGEVIGFEQSERTLVGIGDHAGRLAISRCAKVSFFDQLGNKHSAILDTAKRTLTASIGDKVQILYNSAAPEEAVIKSYSHILKTPSVVTALGILSVAVKYTA